MVGYNDVVANSMTVASVGGSQECLAVVVEVTNFITLDSGPCLYCDVCYVWLSTGP